MSDWQARLDELIAEGRAQSGQDAIRGALEAALDDLGPGADAMLTPSVAVLGTVTCPAGWLGVLVRPTGRTTLHVGSTIVGLVEQVREQETLGAVGVSAHGDRAIEVQAWTSTHPSVTVVEVGAERSLIGVAVPPMYSGMGFDEADLLDACGVAGVIAHRFC